MVQKLKVDKIVEAMKIAAKEAKSKTPFNPAIKSNDIKGINVRDMRQEAMEQGSHGASEYFGEKE